MTQPEIVASLPASFTLYLARHATPDRSRHDIPYHIPPGPPLTEKGLKEAAELGEFLTRQRVVHILASPLERTWRTASTASELSGATLEQNIDLAEWRPDESEKALFERVLRALALGCQLSAKAGPVALVSHGAAVLTVLKALGLPAEIIERCRIYDSRNPLPPAGAWRIERVDGELTIRLAFVPQGVKLPAVKAE